MRSSRSEMTVLLEDVVGDELQVGPPEDGDAPALEVLHALDVGVGRHREKYTRAHVRRQQQARLQPVRPAEQTGNTPIAKSICLLASASFTAPAPLKKIDSTFVPSALSAPQRCRQ